MFDVKSIYGLPLDTADRIVKCEGFSIKAVDYIPPRGKLGTDARVIRAEITDTTVNVVLGWFKTNIME